MCLAEALLRIPDGDTVDRLIRDKIAAADWEQPSRPFRLALRQRLDLGADADRPAAARHDRARAISRGPAPLCRALRRAGGAPGGDRGDAHPRRANSSWAAPSTRRSTRAAASEREGYRHSYDMLGEAARTAADAARYRALPRGDRGDRPRRRAASRSRRRPASRSSCRRCIRATRWRSASGSCASCCRALPISPSKRAHAGIGFTIDAEEADRLELSLDLIEALAANAGARRLERARPRGAGLSEARAAADRLARRAGASRRSAG